MGITANLVLGGSGLIGKELQKQLIRNGERVINLDIREGIDLRNHSLDKYAEVDYVWFLAWDSGGAKYLTNEKNFSNIYRNNARLCDNVFAFVEKYKKPFLFTSSQLAAADTPYGLTKLFGEKWGELLGGKIVRLWNVYGWEEPDERSHVIPDLIMQALVKKKIEMMTSGEEKRQFIYVEDCVSNMIRIRQTDGNSFSLTNGKWIKIREVADAIGAALKIQVISGAHKGYENLIETGHLPDQFTYPCSLENGINKMIESAELFLKSKPSMAAR